MKTQKGFTLIELIMVIVLLGILAAVAVVKFSNMSQSAVDASAQGMAGYLGTAMATNYSVRSGGLGGQAVTNCTDASALLEGGLPTGYVITSTVITTAAQNNCTVTFTSGTYTGVATFMGIPIS